MSPPVDFATHCERDHDHDPENCGIEITPEMIRAGVRVLLLREDETFSGRASVSLESLVAEVYEAMALLHPEAS